jgi:hypothetical protein
MTHAIILCNKKRIFAVFWWKAEGLNRKFMPVWKRVGKNLPVVILVVETDAAIL